MSETAGSANNALEIPNGLELPEELRGPTPRPLPECVKQSRVAQNRRNLFYGCLVAGGMCFLLEPLPAVKTISLYFLPLGYLLWIGLGLCAIGILGYLLAPEFKRACKYIEQGEAAFGRVLELVKTPTLLVHGNPSMYAIVANVRMVNPETGQLCDQAMKSRDFGTSFKEQISTRFRIGDLVPVVWMPNQFDKTAKIYDFLEITPEASLLREGARQTPLYQVVLGVMLIVGIIFSLGWNVYALGRYSPLDFDFAGQGFWPITIGGVLGLAGGVALIYTKLRTGRRIQKQNAEAQAAGQAVEVVAKRSRWSKVLWYVILPLGCALLMAGTVVSWCYTANALLDKSPRQAEPVIITGAIQTTHKGIIREYTLKYRRREDKKDRSLMTTPEHIDKFVAPVGMAQVRNGWLGWKWVETIDPINMMNK